MQVHHRAYAGRDVLNAPTLKSRILARSRQRGDAAPVQAWLLNHFYRHTVANFQAPAPAVQRVDSPDAARALLRTATLPAWLAERLRRVGGPVLWWVDPDGEQLLAVEARLVEFLGSRAGTPLDGKLMRVNTPQALALWAAEHAAIEAQATSGWREHAPEAVRVVWQGPREVFVELVGDSAALRGEMAFESQAMRHCLGQFSDRRALTGGYGEHYAAACEAGRMRLFSYRTGQQQPRLTISAQVGADGLLAIDQIKGKQNRPPLERYRDVVQAFLNTLPTSDMTPADAVAMDLVRTRSGWCAVSALHAPDEQLRAVHRHPAVVRKLPGIAPAVQWLVAARAPGLLEGLALSDGVARALGGSA
ncbi:hypothetical protein [Pseudorhodoferax sp.]|uniref:hypothetical protein n=1 Tax=Pseudorhodoferax sp. TaxID=1993553 RepID=UPI002DD61EE8|nr:hypothetical protein [Pseudorhodoferax sp.]